MGKNWVNFQEELKEITEKIGNGDLKKKVHIRTKEKCPKCGKEFEHLEGLGIICLKCKTVPRRFFIDLTWQGKRIKIYSTKDGQVLSSYEQAKRLQEVILYEIQNHSFDPSKYVRKEFKEFLFENCIEKWLEFSEIRLKPGSMKDRKRIARNLLVPHFKGIDVREIKTAHVYDFFMHLSKLKLSNKTIYNILAELKAFLNFLKKRGEISDLPAIPEVKVEDKPIVWLTQEMQKKILSFIPDEHKPIFIFMFSYGCRPGEARALMWDAVDFENELIFIKRTFSNKKLVDIPKEGKWKVFPMLPHIKEILLDLFSKKTSMFVFRWRYDHYGERSLPRIWKEACKKAGIEGVSLYAGVRHSFAMQRLREGFSYEEIGACLGHSDVRTTRRYGRLMAQNLAKVFSKSAEIIDFEEYRQLKRKTSSNSKKISSENS